MYWVRTWSGCTSNDRTVEVVENTSGLDGNRKLPLFHFCMGKYNDLSFIMTNETEWARMTIWYFVCSYKSSKWWLHRQMYLLGLEPWIAQSSSKPKSVWSDTLIVAEINLMVALTKSKQSVPAGWLWLRDATQRNSTITRVGKLSHSPRCYCTCGNGNAKHLHCPVRRSLWPADLSWQFCTWVNSPGSPSSAGSAKALTQAC